MPVGFDASFLIPLLDPMVKSAGETDARLDYLLRTLDQAKIRIIVLTRALCEVLIGATGSAPLYLDIINKLPRFKVAPFGTRAAVEAATAHRDALHTGDKKEGAPSWAKVKFDRQIVAIAKVEGAEAIYSNDDDIVRFAARDKIEVITRGMLKFPPEKPQRELTFDPDDRGAK